MVQASQSLGDEADLSVFLRCNYLSSLNTLNKTAVTKHSSETKQTRKDCCNCTMLPALCRFDRCLCCRTQEQGIACNYFSDNALNLTKVSCNCIRTA